MRLSILSPTLLATGLLAVLLTGCGKKPDGTPYGVDPARLPEGRRKAKSATTMYKQDVPKGAELNAVTNSARSGQPTTSISPGAASAAPAR